MSKTLTIAIDGPAASGKSTVAEILAEKLNLLYLDTGAMYRAVTLAALNQLNGVADEIQVSNLSKKIKIDIQPAAKRDRRMNVVLLDGIDVTRDIRSCEVNANVSAVSAYPIVRDEMTHQQRRIGHRGNVVMVGRDIGTIVMPDADLKFYIEASAEVRAERRHLEVNQRGSKETYDEILSSLKKRDEIDSNRVIAPLKPAEDAIIINTDHLTKDEVIDKLLSYCTQWSLENKGTKL